MERQKDISGRVTAASGNLGAPCNIGIDFVEVTRRSDGHDSSPEGHRERSESFKDDDLEGLARAN
jgi:hypothetical protein